MSHPESSQVGRRSCSRGARGLEEEEENGGGGLCCALPVLGTNGEHEGQPLRVAAWRCLGSKALALLCPTPAPFLAFRGAQAPPEAVLEQGIRIWIRVALGLCLVVEPLRLGLSAVRRGGGKKGPVCGTCLFPCQEGLGVRQSLATRFGVDKPNELSGAEHLGGFGARWGRCGQMGWR